MDYLFIVWFSVILVTAFTIYGTHKKGEPWITFSNLFCVLIIFSLATFVIDISESTTDHIMLVREKCNSLNGTLVSERHGFGFMSDVPYCVYQKNGVFVKEELVQTKDGVILVEATGR